MEQTIKGPRGGHVTLRTCDFCGKSVRFWGGQHGGRSGALQTNGQRGWLGVYHYGKVDSCLACLHLLDNSQT